MAIKRTQKKLMKTNKVRVSRETQVITTWAT